VQQGFVWSKPCRLPDILTLASYQTLTKLRAVTLPAFHTLRKNGFTLTVST
jgi:hypothetical protein